jgi:hypothetical protein
MKSKVREFKGQNPIRSTTAIDDKTLAQANTYL